MLGFSFCPANRVKSDGFPQHKCHTVVNQRNLYSDAHIYLSAFFKKNPKPNSPSFYFHSFFSFTLVSPGEHRVAQFVCYSSLAGSYCFETMQ